MIHLMLCHQKLMAGMTEFIQKVASKLNVRESGYRLITNIGKDGGQEVHHLHFHLIGGEPAGRLVRDRQEINSCLDFKLFSFLEMNLKP